VILPLLKCQKILEDSSQASSATNNDGSIDLDQLVCYNCRASHDYSDEDKYNLNDPLFDPCNAVLLCDAPNCRAQAFHQRCHFVPIFSIPRGEWICLLCQYEQSLQKKTTKHFAKATTTAESQPVANAASLSSASSFLVSGSRLSIVYQTYVLQNIRFLFTLIQSA